MATENRIINVNFNGGTIAKTESLWQFDRGRELVFMDIKLPETFEVHFSNNPLGKAKRYFGTNNRIVIPKEYLKSGIAIHAWIYLHDTEHDGETKYKVLIPVMKRPEVVDEPIEDEEESEVARFLAALNNGVKEARSWAEGETGARENESTNNAKYYCEQAQNAVNSVNGALRAKLTPSNNDYVLDKTFNEIKEAFLNGKTVVVEREDAFDGTEYSCVYSLMSNDTESYYTVNMLFREGTVVCETSTPDDYPVWHVRI